MGKHIDRNTKIKSTSDISVGDLVDAIAARLDKGSPREAIEKVVKETVRPCAIGRVPTVTAGIDYGHKDGDHSSVAVSGDGNTRRFRDGRLCPEAEAEAGASVTAGRADADDVAPQPAGRFASGDAGDVIVRADHRSVKTPYMATSSKWYNVVLQNGEVWTPYTSRRFLPAQYLSLMLQYDGNINAAIACRYTMRDMWRLLDTELEKLVFMDMHWHSAFVERRRFLPIETVKAIFREYLEGLEQNINDRTKCVFKKGTGEYWRKIQGEGRVVLWKEELTSQDGPNGANTETKAIEPTPWLVRLNDQIRTAMAKVAQCTTYAKALSVLRAFMPKVSMGTFRDANGRVRFWLPKAWKAAFMKQGAYYTLKSLVVNCHVRYTTEEDDWHNRKVETAANAREGLDRLAKLSDEEVPAYVVHAILRKSIEASKFDVAKFLRRVGRR